MTVNRTHRFSVRQTDAGVYFMRPPDEQFMPLLGQDRNDGLAPHVGYTDSDWPALLALKHASRERGTGKERCSGVVRAENESVSVG